ncbi:hypothetical protein FKR81_29010 [Lentzea tibetensis]|uniref:Uncharacterized protein n=1 Tax=Lentzea tibetensis TaxID=2591470 RepID=A0A563EMD4_9PSEU|nr:hypothetical protein [Lentzea tibetensis]TWP48330.1 hypothetical protein FKR81_29010 [Lentzea tibetensis]
MTFDLSTLSGRPVADAVGRLESDGYDVQVLDLDTNPMVTMDFREDRMRVWHRGGVVDHVTNG